MRLASYTVRGRPSYGAVVGDGIVDLRMRFASRHPTLVELLRDHALDEARGMLKGVRPDFPLADVTLLPPLVAPEKILCIGINYANRNQDFDDPDVPRYPSMFFRAPSSLVAHGQPLVRPKVSEQLDYEGEIALVVGREGRHVPRERALEHVAGVTLCNEGTVRDWLRHGKFNVTQGKNFDASGSLGPWIVSADDVDPGKPLRVATRVNGELRQEDTTDRLTWGFAWLINYISTFATLRPGDLIWTGTPTGAGGHHNPPKWLKPGDVVEVEVLEIGVLSNAVVDEA